jgi:hypothetical protein
MPARSVAEDDLVVVSHIVTPEALGRGGTTACFCATLEVHVKPEQDFTGW